MIISNKEFWASFPPRKYYDEIEKEKRREQSRRFPVFKSILSFGGGIESTAIVVLTLQKRNHISLGYVDYGQPEIIKNAELKVAERLAGEYPGAVDCRVYDAGGFISRSMLGKSETRRQVNESPVITPGRNSLMAMMLAKDANEIMFGYTSAPNQVKDNSLEWIEETSKYLSYVMGRNIVISAPYINTAKWDLFELAYEVNPEIMLQSNSCLIGSNDRKCPCENCSVFYKYLTYRGIKL